MKINDLLNEDVTKHPALQGWDEMGEYDKQRALRNAGLVGPGYMGDGAKSDEVLHQAKLRAREREYELEIGPEKLAELRRKAEELVEIKRQQLRKEALEDAELTFQRAETVAQRQAEMEKIKRKFEHDLKVIDTEHRNNMEAIKTGNTHEIAKMDKEHQHEKEMFDKEAGERAKDRAERERDRQQAQSAPSPEPEVEPEDNSDFEKFKSDLYKLSGLPLSAPANQEPQKPSKYNNDDVIDVDFKEVPDKEDDKGSPMLPGPKKENIASFRDIVDQNSKPKADTKPIPNLQKKFAIGQTVKFGHWLSPEKHQVGKIVNIDDHVLTIDVDGTPVKVHKGNKSLAINIIDEKQV